jgi:hypothetical protein
VALWCSALLAPLWSGCAAFHPIDGVPAKYLPDEFKGVHRTGKATIDLSLLRQTSPPEHRVDAGDVLGVYVESVLGNSEIAAPPVHVPTNQDDPPSIGFPITVRSDGTITLPYLKPINVRGLTIQEVEQRVRKGYTQDHPILQTGDTPPVMVTLQKPRGYRVLVVRQEVGNDFSSEGAIKSFNPGNFGNLGASKRGNAGVIRLPAYKNDVLHALAESGGLPGLDAANAIYVIRNRDCGVTIDLPPDEGVVPTPAPAAETPDEADSMLWGHSLISANQFVEDTWGHCQIPFIISDATIEKPEVIKIPLRYWPGEVPQFAPEDVILEDGDIVYVETRETEIYFTGGLLGGGQYTLPRDYDLDVLQALSIAMSDGTGVSGQSINRSIGGVAAVNQDVTVGASNIIVLRKLPNGTEVPIKIDLYEALRDPSERILIQPGDYVMLQYTKLEAVAAFVERHIIEPATLGVASAFLYNFDD